MAAGVQADKTAAAVPAKQRVRDTPGNVFAHSADNGAAHGEKQASAGIDEAKSKPQSTSGNKPAGKPEPAPVNPPPNDKSGRPKRREQAANTKTQAAADVAAAADKAKITRLSNEAADAEKSGDVLLRNAKIDEAQKLLRPFLPKQPGDTWEEVVKRLDVSSPRDGAVFWSGDPKAAQKSASEIGGVTLETTPGGRVLDGWEDLKAYNWDANSGKDGPYARTLWGLVSSEFAKGAEGVVNTVQTKAKLSATYTLWHNVEKKEILLGMRSGEVSVLNMYALGDAGELIKLNKKEALPLLKLKGTAPL